MTAEQAFTPAQLTQITALITDALDSRPQRRYLTAADAATYLGVTRAWLNDHRSELAPCTVGTGDEGVMRFDTAALDAYVVGCTAEHLERKSNSAETQERNAT